MLAEYIQKIEGYTRGERFHPLKTAVELTPNGSVDTHPWHAVFTEVFGTDYPQHLEGKLVAVPYLDAGWGHMFQAWMLAKGLSEIGVRAIFFEATDPATEREAHGTRMKLAVLKALHNGTGFAEVRRLIRSGHTATEKMVDLVRAMIYSYALVQVDVSEGNHHRSLAHHLVGGINHMLEEVDGSMARMFYRMSVQLEGTLADRSLNESLVAFLDTHHVDLVVSTHSTAGRALVGDRVYGNKLIVATPDPGYNTATTLQPFAVLDESKGLTHLVASDEVKVLMTRYFGIDPETIIPVGTICDSMSREAFEAKWNVPEKRILLSTSGNGSHMRLIAQAIREMARELLKPDTEYRVQVFLGNHPEEKIIEVLQAIGESGLENCPHFEIIRTATPSETADEKWVAKRWAHVEFAKPGEQALDCPSSGTVFIGLPDGAPNEVSNLQIATGWGGAFPSAWPASTYLHWRNRGFSQLKDVFYRSYADFFEYISYLFSTKREGVSLNEQVARFGFANAPRQGTDYTIAAVLANLIEHAKRIQRARAQNARDILREIIQKAR